METYSINESLQKGKRSYYPTFPRVDFESCLIMRLHYIMISFRDVFSNWGQGREERRGRQMRRQTGKAAHSQNKMNSKQSYKVNKNLCSSNMTNFSFSLNICHILCSILPNRLLWLRIGVVSHLCIPPLGQYLPNMDI